MSELKEYVAYMLNQGYPEKDIEKFIVNYQKKYPESQVVE